MFHPRFRSARRAFHLRLLLASSLAGTLGLAAHAQVYINEILVHNPGRPNDPDAKLDMDGRSPGWVELRNAGGTPVDLTGWALSDEPGLPGKWVFAAPVAPATTPTTIGAGGYKLVFCGGLERNVANVEPHTHFKLDGSGSIILSRPDGSGGWFVVDQLGSQTVPYPPQRQAVAYGRPGNDATAAPVFFEQDSPGTANPATGLIGFCADTRFSVDRGFYDAPFTLTLTSATPGATLAYTLNGSAPGPHNGTRVAAPDAATPPTASIEITGTTIVRARAWKAGLGSTDIDTQTYIFPAQVLTQSGPLSSMGLTAAMTYNWGATGGDLRSPAGPDWAVDEAIVNHTTTTNRLTLEDLKSLPVVSVVTDWVAAFGPQSIATASNPPPVDQRGFYVGSGVGVANEGADRACSIELLNPLGNPAQPNPRRELPGGPWINRGFQADGNVHVFGGTSQNRWKSYKLSMRVKTQEDVSFPLYGDEGAATQDLFIMDARLNQTWLHPDGGQRARGDYVRDHVMADLNKALGGHAPHSRPVHYFLNGLYWGLYILHEKPDEKFMADYRGGTQDDWDIFKHSARHGTDGGAFFNNVIASGLIDPAKPLGSASDSQFLNCTTLRNYEELMDLLGIGRVAPNPAPNLTQQAAFEAVAARLDITDFIHYVLLNAVAANTDWPHKNYYASFPRHRPDGKWTFHSWDAEHVFKEAGDNTFTSGNWTGDDGGAGAIMRKLALNPEFRLRFADAAHRHLFNDGVLSLAGLRAAFSRRFAEIEPAGVRGESARWGDNRVDATPYTYTGAWTTEKNRLLNTVLPGRAGLGATPSTTTLNQLRGFRVGITAYPLYPSTAAPEFHDAATDQAQHGGAVPAGFVLKLNNPNAGAAGTVYFTTDGSDPRVAWTGAVAAGAQTYSAPVPLPASRRVKARVLNGTTWSAINDAWFSVAADPASSANLVVSKIHYHPAAPTTAEVDAGFTDQDDFEFLELMNIGPRPVDLVGVAFGAGLDLEISETAPVREVAPGGRVLLVRNPAAMSQRYGPGLPVAGVFANASGLSNGGESVQLLARNGTIIRSFTYDDTPPWPASADGYGPCLVLVRPQENPDHSRPENWRLSVEAGGQPTTDDRILYADWRGRHFNAAEAADPGVSGPEADPDADGLANAFEYAVGSNPQLADGHRYLPVFTVTELDPGTGPEPYGWISLGIVWAAEDATFVAETGPDLVSWSPEPAGVVRVSTLDHGYGNATVYWRTTNPIGQPDRLYLRVRTGVP
jgi:hypothetical protein